eukprot:TRINITY_DN2133_c0_g2_i1.p1 TRINITY_DN2133_c0_g2~~TRINITY_DN2133_c0_g2_i1.p1  ORF type:complete len:305 (+),score=43.13 TRINITY_DN2133_c0_g2_i1:48-917(+)
MAPSQLKMIPDKHVPLTAGRVVLVLMAGMVTGVLAGWKDEAVDAATAVDVATRANAAEQSPTEEVRARRLGFTYADCFPASAQAVVKGVGKTLMRHIRTGDQVLTGTSRGSLAFEPVLGHLHLAAEQHTIFRRIFHRHGSFDASAGHLVFVVGQDGSSVSKAVGDIFVGDILQHFDDGTGEQVRSETLAVSAYAAEGVYAPVTASGVLVVDGVSASNYATLSGSMPVGHGAMHSSAFLLRGVAMLNRDWAGLLQACCFTAMLFPMYSFMLPAGLQKREVSRLCFSSFSH